MKLGIILLGALLLRLVLFLGPRNVDHYLYVEQAHRIVEGRYVVQPIPQSNRLGWVGPLAAVQSVLGLNDVSSAVLCILSSLLHIAAAYVLAGALFSRRVALLAAGIVAVLPLDVLHATQVFPDLPATAMCAMATALLVRESRRDRAQAFPVLIAGALLGWAFLIKQTAAFYVLALAVWILWQRRWRLAWAAVPLAAFVVAELALFAILTGDPLYRITQGNAQVAADNRRDYFPDSSSVIARLVWRLPSILLNPLDREFPLFAGLPWLFLAAALWRRRDPAVRLLLGFSGIIFVLVWFWPLTLSPFVPALIAEARHLCFLVVPMAVVVAAAGIELGARTRWVLGAALAIVCLTGAVLGHQYLARFDAGHRAAFEVLRDRGARHIRAIDGAMYYRYRSRYSEEYRIRPFTAEELPGLKDEFVVLDDRRPWIRDLAIPSSWIPIWSRDFPERFDPRRFRAAGTYRIRIYHAP